MTSAQIREAIHTCNDAIIYFADRASKAERNGRKDIVEFCNMMIEFNQSQVADLTKALLQKLTY